MQILSAIVRHLRTLPLIAARRMFVAWAAVAAFGLCALASDPALAGRRVALVIGNSAYDHAGKLPNTGNDAVAMAALFNKAGFDVVDLRQNLGVVEFKRAVRSFMSAAHDADVAVVYYAGHGIEIGGKNYLVPADAKLASEYDAEDEAVAVERVSLALQPARQLRLIILDACRENPFLKKIQRNVAMRGASTGLAKIDSIDSDNTVIAYAAKAGSYSLDGNGPNSPFATALLKYITQPGLDIRLALGKVHDEVLSMTHNEQEPYIYISLGGTNVSLVPAPEAKPEVKKEPDDPNAVIRHDYELAEKVGTREAWESFLRLHPQGFFADLARGQVAKMTPPAETSKPPVKQKEAETAKPPVKQKEAMLPERHEEPTSKPPSQAELCRREADELRQLRAHPKREEIEKFAQQLTCDSLRPQIARLIESIEPSPSPPRDDATLPKKPEASDDKPVRETPPTVRRQEPLPDPDSASDANSCKRDKDQLAKLRANPVAADIKRFAHDLHCEALRAQVARLLESVGD